MALSAASILQTGHGNATAAASIAVTLGAGTTAGSSVIVVTFCALSTVGDTSFDQDLQGAGTAPIQFHRKVVGAGETSWTFTPSLALITGAWVVLEVAGVEPYAPLPVIPTTNVTGTGSLTTLSSGTSPSNDVPGVMALAAHAQLASRTPAPTWASHTNSFVEQAEDGAVSGATSYALSVSALFGDTGTYECTATVSATGSDAVGFGAMMLYRETMTVPVIPADVMAS